MFFEKMFAHKVIDKKAEQVNLKTERGISLDKLAKIAAILAIFTMPQGAKAEGTTNRAENIKQKVEEANLNLGKIIEFIKVNDKRENHYIHQTQVKQADFSLERQLIAANDGRYAVFFKNGGKKAFCDKDSDGRLDRIVINNKNYESNSVQKENEQRNSEDYIYLFDSVDNLAETAKVVGDVKPEPVTVIDIDNEKNIVTVIDSNDGSVGISTPEQGEEFIEKLQSSYAKELAEIAKEIGK
jgi:hypothetical protein